MTGMPIVNVEAGCASGGAALGLGVEAIRSRALRHACWSSAWRRCRRASSARRSSSPGARQAGLAVTPAYFALRAQRLMRDSGVTREHLAYVSVKNHRNGVHNPYAMFRKAFTLDAVLGVGGRLRAADALHAVLAQRGRRGGRAAPRRGGGRRVAVRAAALRSHLPGSVLGEHTPMCGLLDDDLPAPTELAARAAYEEAGIGPEDLDVVELQDTDSARELLSCEELGLCAKGGAGQMIAERRTDMGGPLPVNPSGGLLSKGEPLGASALGQVVELYWQLRGEAGPRQVPDAQGRPRPHRRPRRQRLGGDPQQVTG